jgi:hypothetical protein
VLAGILEIRRVWVYVRILRPHCPEYLDRVSGVSGHRVPNPRFKKLKDSTMGFERNLGYELLDMSEDNALKDIQFHQLH